MRRQTGFTLVELMVVIAIIGILAVTALPLYRTWQQRAYGSEASLMMKKLLDGEIMYYLDKNTFFPENSSTPMEVLPTADQNNVTILNIATALKITIPVGHHLTYQIYTGDASADEWCQIQISAPFPLYKGGARQLVGTVTKDGRVDIFAGG